MKFYILMPLLFVFSCSHNMVQSGRIPAFSADSDLQKNCEAEIKGIGSELTDMFNQKTNLFDYNSNKKINSEIKNISVTCDANFETASLYSVDKDQKKIKLDPTLKYSEQLFETENAKKQVANLDIELRAVTLSQLKAATLLQAYYDVVVGPDLNMKYYFSYIKYIQSK